MSRIAAYKKRIENITDSMITFALDPSKEKFDEICACESLVRSSGEFFPLFRDTALMCYGKEWGTTTNTDIEETINALKEVAIRAPTFTISTKLMYVFYASGQLSIIELYYQIMGWETLPRNTKEQLAQLYKDVKYKWQTRCADLHRDGYAVRVRSDIADFSYFDNIKERAIEEREREHDLRRALGQ